MDTYASETLIELRTLSFLYRTIPLLAQSPIL